ncbi:hypothetical protein ACQI4L_14545 [Mycolicibacterium litorale]|uniref:hypothetical protein n=1 Tax=Mycolicibacterium litorale TaxID=758802 RepID=UPI003CF43952
MSTIAAKFSEASMSVKVGAAAVAVVAAATITPALAEATPDIASAVETYSVSDMVVIPEGIYEYGRTSASVAAAAADDFNPITTIGGLVDAALRAVGTFAYNVATAFISGVQFVVDEIARVLRVGPYANVG